MTKKIFMIFIFSLAILCLVGCGKNYDISVEKDSYIAFVGDEKTIEVNNPENAPLSFKSSNMDIITVSDDGKIEVKKEGECTITISAGKTKVEVKYNVYSAINTFTLNQTEITRTIGDTDVRIQLQPIIDPQLEGLNVVYSVSGTAATVSSSGVVLINASRKGEAIITASIEGTNYTTMCKVNVNAIPIATAQELYAIRNDLTNDYELVADIDLSNFNSPVGIGWDPIGKDDSAPFMGTFNGNGYKITGLTINNPSQTDSSKVRYFIGLFGYVRGATIENVYLENINITASHNPNFVGGIAGVLAEPCTVNNCAVTGTINLLVPTSEAEGNSCAGGIVGELYDSISNCYSAVNIYLSSSYSYAGGVVGGVFPKTVGTADSPSVISVPYIRDCYYVGNIDGSRIAGVVYKALGNVVNCTYDKDVAPYLDLWKEGADDLDNLAMAELLSKYISLVNSKGLSTSELQSSSLNLGWDINVWKIDEGFYPRLKTCAEQKKVTDIEYLDTIVITDNNNYSSIMNIANIKFNPSSSTFTSLKWTSANQNDLYISATGLVFAYKKGNYNVTGKLVEGNKEVSISVIVNELSSSFAGGVGTSDNPYLINNEDQLRKINENTSAYYKLISDIKLTKVWNPIQTFTGSIDGDGHVISNLTVKTGDEFNGGFVGFNDGTIKNIAFDNVNIKGGNFVGGIAVINRPTGLIDNCFISGYIKGTNVGGTICAESYAPITNTYSVATLDVPGKAAGLVYQLAAETGYIQNSYFAGTILGSDATKAGITYIIYYPAKVVSAFYLDSVSTVGYKQKDESVSSANLNIIATSLASFKSGDNIGLGSKYTYEVGYLPRLNTLGGQEKNPTINIADKEISKLNSGVNLSNIITIPENSGLTAITGYSSSDSNIISIDNNGIINVVATTGYATITINFIEGNSATVKLTISKGLDGEGTANNPFLIKSYEDLLLVSINPSACYKLMANIDMTSKDWTPISEFKGVFDGNGYIISNLTLKDNIDMFGGFCSYNDGTIKNLRLTNVSLENTATTSTWKYTAGIAAVNRSKAVIENCCVDGGTIKGSRIVCGICVENYGKITNCYVKANIEAGEHAVGIAFITFEGSEISSTYFKGNLTAGSLAYAIVIDVVGNINTTKIANNYYLNTQEGVFNATFKAGATALTESDFVSGAISLFSGFDTNVWEFASGKTPSLK